MGGNALRADSVRLPAARYRAVEQAALETLRAHYPGRRIAALASFAGKADFGDLDILIEAGAGYDPASCAAVLQATEIVLNGDVCSIGVRVEEGIFQIDLIGIGAASFAFAECYFAYNDLGNLIGRVGHQFGLKFGHQGLLYPLRDPDNASHLIAELCITTDFDLALDLLGYDAARYRSARAGGQLRTLDDIFQFAVSSPYSNRDIYLLENRNHKARIRDAKRPNYNAFLDWLDRQPPDTLPAYPWAPTGSAQRRQQQARFLDQAFARVPAFREAHDLALAASVRAKLLKRQFNGELAARATGLAGQALGQLMTRVRHSFPDQVSFETFFIEASPDQVEARFLREAQADQ